MVALLLFGRNDHQIKAHRATDHSEIPKANRGVLGDACECDGIAQHPNASDIASVAVKAPARMNKCVW
jgi:hypothetical protein